MKNLTDTYVLNNGVKIPCIGFGTWQTPEGEVAYESVKAALECGYRHIDTAAMYGNEASVGRAVKESGIKREDIFITSKLGNTQHGYEDTKEAFLQTLANLGTDYLDLYLIHWPNPIKYRNSWQDANAGSWKAMEEFYEQGKVSALGISNFLPHHIDALLETAKIKPAINQIRLCPGLTQEEVSAYCLEHDILLEAYSPLGTGKLFTVEKMQELAAKYGKTIAQVGIRWSLQMGYLPLPKSVTPSRIKENTEIFDFTLTEEDAAVIAGLTECCGGVADPDLTNF
ncbi:Aldo/keto reductase [Anaerocolumna jejuensis DSM 15929]|uniref:Aldo/keto reductase n=1 Tax=Anaerocolumna jejuensis DSM 15929 TaxID=1121322 RepID=A0A1M6QWF1_9FIRM|nr:aldo/keto reductase [Anaerocolumna jejuensis]SHK24480.1 Aldo/keto reductase [Anaerocolumna jejuensis DSM 15929]